jgi:hypothetical protein
MIVTKDIVFVHIPKTAGRSIYLALSKSLDVEYNKQGFSIGYNHLPIHSKCSDVKQLMGEDYATAYKFSIVRNPYDRMVSFFMYGNINFSRKFSTFELFVRYVCGQNDTFPNWNTAKLTQVEYLNDELDAIVRLEDIDNFWLSIRERFKCGELPKVNNSIHQHYSHYYTPELEQMVREYFIEDFKQFYPELL